MDHGLLVLQIVNQQVIENLQEQWLSLELEQHALQL
jgi:hypothetical protein